MGNATDPFDQIAFLAGSSVRADLLVRLLERGPASPRELGEHLEASRSTISRTVQALEEHEWVERNGGECRLTPLGTVVTETFLEGRAEMRSVSELSPFLRWFPDSAFDVDPSLLLGSDVYTSTDTDPYGAARRGRELAADADRIRTLLPIIQATGRETVYRRVMDGELEVEAVVSPHLEETYRSEPFAPRLHEMLRTSNYTLRVSRRDVPIYVGLTEDRVQLGVLDDDGFLRAILETPADPPRAWAEDVYGEYFERSSERSAGDFRGAID